MANDALCKIDELAWHGEACSFALRSLGGEQVVIATLDAPDDGLGRNARLGEVARGLAPALQIIFGRKRNAVSVDHWAFAKHGYAANNSNCCCLGAIKVRRSARSVSKVGRQSIAAMNGRTLAIERVNLATSS